MTSRISSPLAAGLPAAAAHAGGCLCGDVRYQTTHKPVRVTICHCTFCQRLTGSAYLVEPIFKKEDVVLAGNPKVYHHRSDGSGKRVSVHFCDRCGTTLYLDLERFADMLGICGGTFDHPDWFDRCAANCRHIYIRSAQAGVTLPAGVNMYQEHAVELDGTPNQPTVFAHALTMSRQRPLT